MKKRTFSIFLTIFMVMIGIDVKAQENERLSFGVISDIHFENEIGEGAMIKVPKALKNLTSRNQLDVLVVVGDLTNNGRAEQYEMLVNVFSNEANFINPMSNFGGSHSFSRHDRLSSDHGR